MKHTQFHLGGPISFTILLSLYFLMVTLIVTHIDPVSGVAAIDADPGADLVVRDYTRPENDLVLNPSMFEVKAKPTRPSPIKTQVASAVRVKTESTPIVRVAPPSPETISGWFNTYGAQYGIDPKVLEKIAFCESGYNPQAVNGPYGGMFQFHASTWASNRNAMGLDPNPALRFNGEESVKTAAFKMSRDGVGAWPVCGRR